MSAFVVNKAHLDVLVRLAATHQMTWYHDKARHDPRTELDATGQMLLDECVKSVGYRYGDSPLTDLPGPTDAYWVLPFRYSPLGRVPSPVEGLKLVRCYEYQACEHPEWEKSAAHSFCQALTSALITRLPGYEEAPWDWEDERVRRNHPIGV